MIGNHSQPGWLYSITYTTRSTSIQLIVYTTGTTPCALGLISIKYVYKYMLVRRSTALIGTYHFGFARIMLYQQPDNRFLTTCV